MSHCGAGPVGPPDEQNLFYSVGEVRLICVCVGKMEVVVFVTSCGICE